MGALHRAAAGRHRRAGEPLDAEQVQPDGRADDVGDAVERPDLVEVDRSSGIPWTVASASASLRKIVRASSRCFGVSAPFARIASTSGRKR